jgi:hypothetical protein
MKTRILRLTLLVACLFTIAATISSGSPRADTTTSAVQRIPQTAEEGKTLLNKLIADVQKSAANPNDKPEYQIHIDWSVRDSGPPDCPWAYIADGQDSALCLASTVRSCLMGLAISDAKSGNTQHAFTRTIITQCHNSEAMIVLAKAGPQQVSDYLKNNY